MNLVFGTGREGCELKRADLNTFHISVFVPNPSSLCTVFAFGGFWWVEDSDGGVCGDGGVGRSRACGVMENRDVAHL